MNVGRVALLVLLGAAISLLILDLTSDSPAAETGANRVERAASESEDGAAGGGIVWANWHETAPRKEPREIEIGVVRDLAAEEAEAARKSEVSDARRAEIEERFRGLDVALPIRR